MLLDSRANMIFIDHMFVEQLKLPLIKLDRPIWVFNVDGTQNSARDITCVVELLLEYKEHHEKISAEVIDFGRQQMIISYSWLCCYNPDIDWWTGEVKLTGYHEECRSLQEKSVFAQLIEKEEQDIQYQVLETIKCLEEDRDIAIGQTVNDKLKTLMDQKKTVEVLISEEYHKC